tara:strand:+ start:8249 stop:8401 length:153 start_codon:yes stop_codon:yes gene_type:complete
MKLKAKKVLMIKAVITPKERNQLKAAAALKGVSSQQLVGTLIRMFLTNNS